MGNSIFSLQGLLAFIAITLGITLVVSMAVNIGYEKSRGTNEYAQECIEETIN